MKWLRRILLLFVTVIVISLAAVYFLLCGSLATLEGDIKLDGLSASARIERDELGNATILASNEVDAARLLGFVHAQERFFEMDLLRRSAAGELSELFGKAALEADKNARVHRLRHRVESNLDAFIADKSEVIDAYVEGVNQGLNNLSVRPWPYLLLGEKPKPWQHSDIALVGLAMSFELQDENNKKELALWNMKQVLPSSIYKLFTLDGTKWDAPLFGEPRGDVTLPDVTEIDLRQFEVAQTKNLAKPPSYQPGSNNFAVDRSLTKDGRAILANDMHLAIRAPNIWFRARLKYQDKNAIDNQVDFNGFSLPGTPFILVGSNTHVAFGFTNAYGDYLDWHVVYPEIDEIASYIEVIRIKGQEDFKLAIREANGHPILARDLMGKELSLRWTAHLPEGMNTSFFSLAKAKNIDDVFSIFQKSGWASQNVLIADKSGSIAWTLSGFIEGWHSECDRSNPIDRNDPEDAPCFYEKSLDVNPYRTLKSPASGRLWTANARVTDGEALGLIGDSGYALGARAKQIRDALFAKEQFNESDLLQIQLDDRAIFLKDWWNQLRILINSASGPMAEEVSNVTRNWDERASADAVAYRIVRAWRVAVINRIRQVLLAPAIKQLGQSFELPNLPQFEAVAWAMITQKPAHLLTKDYTSYDALMMEALKEVYNDLTSIGPLKFRTWGERNTAKICHPFAQTLPKFFSRWLCMSEDQLSGDSHMPKVEQPSFGASERMVVSPGHEEEGIIHMPSGQSGHPLSRYWGKGHSAWVKGEPTPFLPGKAEMTLNLSPK